jgi:GTP-binding protein EngB required for normal cell division
MGGSGSRIRRLEDQARSLGADLKNALSNAANAAAEVLQLKRESADARDTLKRVEREGQDRIAVLDRKHKADKERFEAELRADMERANAEAQAKTEKEAQAMVERMRVEAEERFKMMVRAAEEERAKAEAALKEHMDMLRAKAEKLEMAKEKAEESLERITKEKNAVEKKWRTGERPMDRVTLEQLEAAKKMYGYRDDLFHIAIAGVAGAGKSSLLNSFLGLRPTDPNAASVGTKETTLQVTRYEGHPPTVWFDIPGTGTLTIPDWQYFNDRGLYIFDCIIIVIDNRFTESDVAILKNCRLLDPPIPTFLVRSKSDQHIRNAYEDRAGDEDLEGSAKAALMEECKQTFIRDTKENFAANLRKAKLDDTQEVYCVSKEVLRAIVCREKLRPKAMVLDERKLLHDIVAGRSMRWKFGP